MKLFKNEVGRPSNETLEKRNIVKIIIITGIVALLAVIIGVITILIGNNNANKLKGASSNTFRVMYNSNGGTGSMKEQYVEHGKISKLTKNAFTKNEKEFTGWIAKRIVNGNELFRGCKTSGQCTNNKASWMRDSIIKSYFIYKDEEIVSKTAPIGETVYMYAQWSGEKNGVVSNSTNSNNTNSVNQSTISNKKSGGFLNSLKSLISKTIEFFSKITIKKPVIKTTTRKVEEQIIVQSTTSQIENTTLERTTSKAEDNFTETKGKTDSCRFPYSKDSCSGETNEVVKTIQKMLNSYDSSNKLEIDGDFGNATIKAVKSLQEDLGLKQDGIIGHKELVALSEKTNTQYFNVVYSKNGGTGSMDGISVIDGTINGKNQRLAVQTALYDKAGQVLSDSKFKKSGYTHVGYTAKTILNGKTYEFGCTTSKCLTGTAKWIITSDLEDGEKFYPYVYELGQTIRKTGWKNNQEVRFTAKYCSGTNKRYNNKTGKCVKNDGAGQSTIPKYSIAEKNYVTFVAVVCQEDATGYTGAKAVVDTMLNRLDNDRFGGNTLYAVMTASGQFQAYGAGHYKSRLTNGKLKNECADAKKAVNDALEDPKTRSHSYYYFLSSRKYSSDVKIGGNYYRKSF